MDNRLGQKRLMRDRGICVVIPTYNNGGTIEQVVRDTLAQCDDAPHQSSEAVAGRAH